ncbi:efflux RND transporter periplasmic adaptor subunit [Singulisphaera sp. PoT]|uniref:efflux RND transporter periplasmic adaptor subunit n=1 Tax=Singulisphaera sp. PoT TaxID=3411797 RepID=UPI003BF5FB58
MLRKTRRLRYLWVGLGLALTVVGWKAYPRLEQWHRQNSRSFVEWKNVRRATVRRSDLWVSVTTSGLVESTDRTIIECQLQMLDAGVFGKRMSAGGASTILSIVPEGTEVKEGDVICRLDSSDYEELLRQQEMTVQRSKSDHYQSKLNLDVAKMAVNEYRDGVLLQSLKDYDGRIALARAQLERIGDRLRWTQRMLEKGYASVGQLTAERVNERRAAFSLEQSQGEFDLFRRFGAPRAVHQLESNVYGAELNLKYQSARLQRNLERLESIQKQIKNCTIVAPHDGFVIYASDPRRQVRIEEGLVVRQKQPLIYLPDLSRMEVSAMLHESVVDKVRDGQRAKIRVEGISNRQLEGHVVTIAALPTRDPFSQIPYYVATVKVDTPVDGLRPGMSAEVEIDTARRNDVLTVPPSAVKVEDGVEFCYVADDENLVRRPIQVGHLTEDELEVTDGLSEGEEVVADPSTLEDAPAVVTASAETTEEAPAGPTEAQEDLGSAGH